MHRNVYIRVCSPIHGGLRAFIKNKFKRKVVLIKFERTIITSKDRFQTISIPIAVSRNWHCGKICEVTFEEKQNMLIIKPKNG